MTLTDRDRKLVIALIPILLLAAYWFLLLAPKREEAATAADALAAQEQRRDTAQAAANSAQGAKRDFTTDYAQIVRLGKAVPAQVDMPSLLVQLDAAAAGTDIEFTKISTGAREAAPAPTTGTPPSDGADAPVEAGGQTTQSAPGGAVESANDAQATADQRSSSAEQSGVAPGDTQTSTPAGEGTAPGGTATAPAGLETVPLQLEFVGNFFNLADFFHDLKRFVRTTESNVVVGGRLITIEGVRWSSEPEIFPKLRAEITATIYLSPKAQGTTAGATPTGPGQPAPEGTPAASPAPTAAATPGVTP